jgi:hypothetical protein
VKKTFRTILHLLQDTPVFWVTLAFAVYFYYAQFVVTVSWNAIELIIAQHLLDHGTYATSIDYPSALTWRPVLPTLLVTFLRLWTDNPITIYQFFCGATLGCLTGMMFLSAKMLWGKAAGHTAAFLTLVCPATTVYLIDHPHSYSHLGALLLLGPALFTALFLLREADAPSPPTVRLYALSGALWGLCYLCRSELALFCAVHFLLLLFLQIRGKRSFHHLAAYLAAFLFIFVPYNLYAGHVAARDGLLIRKAIYGMYISQGWVDPPSNVGPDIEADGYVYAQKLYGDPLKNGESLFTAIGHNVPAFWRRVRLNAVAFYAKFLDPGFFLPWWGLAVLGLVGLLAGGMVPPSDRRYLVFLLGLFLSAHFILIYHIDARYLTITVPPLLLLTACLIHYVLGWLRRVPAPFHAILPIVVLAGIVYGSRDQFRRVARHRGPNTHSIPAMRSLGEHFRSVVTKPPAGGNREPHVWLVFPDRSPLYAEDQFLLAYFSRTAWVNRGAEGPFPRGRFYSYRECPDDYRYVPAEKIGDAAVTQGGRIVGECDNPILGHYYLVRLGR